MSVSSIIESLSDDSIQKRKVWESNFRAELKKIGFDVDEYAGNLGVLKQGLVTVAVNIPGTQVFVDIAQNKVKAKDVYDNIDSIISYYDSLEKDLNIVNDKIKKAKSVIKKYPYPVK